MQRKSTFLFGKHGRRCTSLSPLNNSESCPVYYVMQHDANRIPEKIVHAECNCKQCRFKQCQKENDCSGSKCEKLSCFRSKCEKVYTYTPVFRQNVDDCEYRKSLESVAVACTCRLDSNAIIQL